MSYKLGLILSIAFMMSVLLLASDLMNVAIIKNSLDALSLTVSYRMAQEGRITQGTRDLVTSYGARLNVEDEREAFRIGDTVTYFLEKDYQPFVLGKDTRQISVRRSAVIGYYRN